MIGSGLLRIISISTLSESLGIRRKASSSLQELLANPLEFIYPITKIDLTNYIRGFICIIRMILKNYKKF